MNRISVDIPIAIILVGGSMKREWNMGRVIVLVISILMVGLGINLLSSSGGLFFTILGVALGGLGAIWTVRLIIGI